MTPPVEVTSLSLPAGYRVRRFRDEDRGAIVAFRNAELPEVEQRTASEWREWEQLVPDDTRARFVVETRGGALAGFCEVSNGGALRAADGSARGGIQVAREHRRKGIASALLPLLESEAKRLGAPKLHSGASARDGDTLAWAQKRGYAEIGRRIEAVIDLERSDSTAHEARVGRVRGAGIHLATLDELRRDTDEAGFETLLHRIYDMEDEAWQDVPVATPMPHWPYEAFRKMLVDSPSRAFDLDVLALDGDLVVGGSTSFRSEGGRKGGTAFTGVLRAYRGRGIAFALKVEVLRRAKGAGMRWMLTTNDEPNKPMRGINHALGYEALPAHIQLQKEL